MPVNHLLPMTVRSTVLAVVEGIALTASMGIVSTYYRGGGGGGRGDNLKHANHSICSQEHQ